MGLHLGYEVHFIKEGYQGLVDGGENIVKAEWASVSGIIHRGGTMIGSARFAFYSGSGSRFFWISDAQIFESGKVG